MNESTKQKITKALDYSGDDSGAYFNEGELEPLTQTIDDVRGCHGELQKIHGSNRDDSLSINDQLEKSRRNHLAESTVEHLKVLNYSLEKRKTVALMCIIW